MKKIALAVVLCCPILANAAGNYEAGEKKSAICIACHGPKGISSNPAWPSIAGQHAAYLVKQLQDFKEGKNRNAATMTPIVANLNKQDMEDLAAFYSEQPLPELATTKKYLARGEQLYRGGDFRQHITACIACHGPQGKGNAQAGFPVLSGQQPIYTIQQLQAFKDHGRQNDLNAIMQDISMRMTKEDMDAVAHYVAGLH
ncbi:c-type cytochrome [Legionella oakridgensis]|uniref:Cytochrome c553 n=2 Tax=Legionella oakridgensis TaxID=29423 RepID=W0B7C7_9GAMM|nr:c-type cytochrome [Legionella oakridgensis]AHE65745.1 cytochrome c553 [Legionella oakridgensis ATCC 33761 = DSM 21215]KTD38182.1 cytochrome c4 [Legionella oakridgensis]STY15688.1 cytochrome c4 [Legionella longbeachae]